MKIRQALISLSDKRGALEFAQGLAAQGVNLLSTGGTAKLLRDAGLAVTEIGDYTGFPEMLDGRVKTLHPKVHGGILARRDLPEHLATIEQHGIPMIDLVCVNLYPFRETVAKGADFDTCIENIDIGGPAMTRAAAKNHDFVTVVTDPADYPALLARLKEHDGATTFDFRKQMAAKAFAMTAGYDGAIAGWFASQGGGWPADLILAGKLHSTLRYGENPHQSAAFYTDGSNRPGAALARQIQGKELSYNNLNDTDAAYELVAEFDTPAVAIIKHANPCGVATHENIATAYRAALACDPVSAFGGIIALNRKLDAETAEEIVKIFTEVIIAPDASAEAKAILAAKKNLRLLLTGSLPDPAQRRLSVKAIAGGYLAQDTDTARILSNDLKIVTKRAPTPEEMSDLLFAFRVAKHVKSNAIVYAAGGATVGIGAGQMSRIDSSRIAAWKMKEMEEERKKKEDSSFFPLPSSLSLASDAFFPFADGLIAAAEAGVTAVIQPGGSVRDAEVIAAADERGLAMVFTGVRHFRH